MSFKLRNLAADGRDEQGRFAEKPAAPLAQVFKHAVEGGETITDAGEELGAPDFEASAVKEGRPGTGADHVQVPVYVEQHPWPAASSDPAPFRLK